MSRNERELWAGTRLVTGWDAPPASFFAQVIESPLDQSKMTPDHPDFDSEESKKDFVLFEAGMRDGDTVDTPEQLSAMLAEAGYTLTVQEQAQLHADKAERGTELTPLQQYMNGVFNFRPVKRPRP